jgi:hypothetical protein
MPRPTRAGVLGMARTMRCVFSQSAMLSLVMPAATLRCRDSPRQSRLPIAASLKVCGLTAQTTRPLGRMPAPAAGSTVALGNCCDSLARCSSQGSTTCKALAGWPWRTRPPMMALAMLPPPMNVMVGSVEEVMVRLSPAPEGGYGATVWRTACSHRAMRSAAWSDDSSG